MPGSAKAQPLPATNRPTIVGMRLVGANARAKMVGLSELEAKSNYYLGSAPAKWRAGIPRYEKVQCKDIYPGIDLIYYGNRDQLEFDFVVSPGANPEVVRLTFEGAESIRLDENGDLVLHTSDREVKLRSPTTYQVRDGQRHVIAAQYGITGENEVSLQVAAYDKNSALVIDPVLSYSTYLGGSDVDFGLNIATDNAGNAYVGGFTLSADFPLKGHSLLNSNQGGVDAFVSKFGPTGPLLYSTYLGGNGDDFGLGITADSSVDFPVKNALQSSDHARHQSACRWSNGDQSNHRELNHRRQFHQPISELRQYQPAQQHRYVQLQLASDHLALEGLARTELAVCLHLGARARRNYSLSWRAPARQY
jgi:hypothetical protein